MTKPVAKDAIVATIPATSAAPVGDERNGGLCDPGWFRTLKVHVHHSDLLPAGHECDCNIRRDRTLPGSTFERVNRKAPTHCQSYLLVPSSFPIDP